MAHPSYELAKNGVFTNFAPLGLLLRRDCRNCDFTDKWIREARGVFYTVPLARRKRTFTMMPTRALLFLRFVFSRVRPQ